jgi:hypothetical protein
LGEVFQALASRRPLVRCRRGSFTPALYVATLLALVLLWPLTSIPRPLHAAQPACYTPEQALAHLGERACVEGLVTNATYASRSNGQPTFLDFGTRFTAVIWGDDRPAFVPAPETLRGRRIVVSGEISEFRGKAQIIVRDPAQIGPAGSVPARTAPTATPRMASATAAPIASPTATVAPPTPPSAAPPGATATVAATAAATAIPAQPTDSPTAAPALAAVTRTTEPVARAMTTSVPVSGQEATTPAQTGGNSSRTMLAAGVGLIGLGAAGGLAYRLRRGR